MTDEVPRLSVDFPAALLASLRARYSEPHRRYHTWSHVLACLEARRLLTEAPLPAVDMALLYHDAVYEPLAADNEARSAELLVEEGRGAGFDARVLERAAAYVLATKHHEAASVDSEEGCIVLDADLSILGADRATFDRYERDVREEYAAVPDDRWITGRRAVIQAFLRRPVLFATEAARRLWEEQARANLEASVAKLAGSALVPG